ncbi:Arylesterase monooxygenase [Pleurostoma richardsiae]|uniref:Arylesterase monooxygenase n=1 Tax=Pleurostoma richardsiae TaxID=41990 RepID=A0AA38VRF5_9PEZI|nr:Arylesterase monooxygenase [Pleurostoma richardsiae]
MATSLRYDPEYQAWKKIADASSGFDNAPPVLDTITKLREFTEKILYHIFRMNPWPEGIEETKTEVTSAHDGATVSVSRFATAAQRASAEPQPAILYIHGGGMVSCTVEIFAPSIAQKAADAGVQMFSPDYRLAPEHPAPTGVYDCFAALQWLSAHARELNVDPARIAVMGDSAGGGLAAGTVLMARDHGLSPPLAKQILVYPMLDDRTTTRIPPDSPLVRWLNWQHSDNVLAWDAYVGPDNRGREDADVSPYAAPARAQSLAGLPPTYIDVGTLDLFRDEDIEYARRLAAENIEVEFHMYPGLPHGFESAVGIGATKRAEENRTRAARTF